MQTFCKEERLTGKTMFDELIKKGKSAFVRPIRVVWLEKEFAGDYPAKAAFVASKKNFKRAIDRNKIKRRMREAYRKNKSTLYEQLQNKKMILLFMYNDSQTAEYSVVEKSMQKLLHKIGHH